MVRRLLLASALLCAASAASAQFAIFSPADVQQIPARKNTPGAQSLLRAARGELSSKPQPMPRVHTEGTLPHQGIRDQSIEAEQDFDKIFNLAAAWRLTGQRPYLDKAAEILDAWMAVYTPSGNPIDETRWEPVLLAFDLIRADVPAPLAARTSAFFHSMSELYCDWLEANPTKDPYNWSSHRIKLAVLGAYSSGDTKLIARASALYRRQVSQNIRKDGEVIDFTKRDALHYVVYDLEPLTIADFAARAHGQDWFHTAATGLPSVEQAMDWLVPFAMGQKSHEEFKHSSVAFDAARDKAGEKGYSGAWDPGSSFTLYAQGTQLDPKYRPVLDRLASGSGRRTPAWLDLLPAPAAPQP